MILISLFLSSCKDSVYDDKNSTIIDLIEHVEEGISINLKEYAIKEEENVSSIEEELLEIVRLKSNEQNLRLTIMKYKKKLTDEEVKKTFLWDAEICEKIYKKGFFIFCKENFTKKHEGTKKFIDFINPTEIK